MYMMNLNLPETPNTRYIKLLERKINDTPCYLYILSQRCHLTKSFECGSVGRHFFFFFFFFYKPNWILDRRDFKYELKKGMTFIPVQFRFQ